MLPIVVAHPNLSPEISFPYRSNPSAWRARFEPASRLTVAGCKATEARAPGTIATIAVPVFNPMVAVTNPMPTCVEAVRSPDASIVPMAPVTFHTKVAPGIVFPKRSFASALKDIVVPATMFATPGETST